jgi:hypothetical protein
MARLNRRIIELLILSSFWNVSGVAYAAELCHYLLQSQLNSTESWRIRQKSLAIAAWFSGRFSNPKSHDPRRFLYVVHAVREDHAGVLNFLRNSSASPEYLISASVVNERKSYTFGRVGFILEVPPENIVSTSPQDTAIINNWVTDSPDFIKKELGAETAEDYKRWLFQKHGISDPTQLINENIALESKQRRVRVTEVNVEKVGPNGRSPTVVAVFYNNTPGEYHFGGEFISQQESKNLARDFGLPLVELGPRSLD